LMHLLHQHLKYHLIYVWFPAASTQQRATAEDLYIIFNYHMKLLKHTPIFHSCFYLVL
jgi:hypothetical protein